MPLAHTMILLYLNRNFPDISEIQLGLQGAESLAPAEFADVLATEKQCKGADVEILGSRPVQARQEKPAIITRIPDHRASQPPQRPDVITG